MMFIVPVLAAVVAAAWLAPEARAQDSSQWQKDSHSAVRLVAGSRSGAVLLGGIAFQLQPGWHTYWRNPGDSGVPPRFDFSRSDNVETVTVLWPAPMKVDVVAPDSKVELFAEGPTPDWALPVPKLLAQSPPGVKRFAFDLDGVPPGASPDGAALKLTLVGGERAYEFNVNLN